jgi:death-on-curing protein
MIAPLKEYGGLAGVRGHHLLESALARPHQLFAYDHNPDINDPLNLAYTTGIVRNHPFVDGNKRTGFLVAVEFLYNNGYRLAKRGGEVDAVVNLAEGSLTEAAFATFLGSAVEAL